MIAEMAAEFLIRFQTDEIVILNIYDNDLLEGDKLKLKDKVMTKWLLKTNNIDFFSGLISRKAISHTRKI